MMRSYSSGRWRPRTFIQALAPTITAVLAACADSPSAVDFEGDAAFGRRLNGTVVIAAPASGAQLSGVQTFTASVPELSLAEYDMYWQVDYRALERMQESDVGGPHTASSVDVSTFTWRGAGPYRVNFVAKDTRGKTINQRYVDIYVAATTPVTPPPVTPPSSAMSIFSSAQLWVEPNSNAKLTADAWRATRPADAAQMDKIATQPQAIWFTGWTGDLTSMSAQAAAIAQAGRTPLFVAYNIPIRDCGSYSAGGAASADAYRTWIRGFATGLGSTRAAVILEPDALAAAGCLTMAQRDERYALVSYAVDVLKAQGSAVYIDAGNPGWLAASDIANRLLLSGIARADGFALNVSNFFTTASNVTYGAAISALVGGKHFVIDTSRNGLGPTADYQWCNPPGRALGAAPTANTGHELIDALLWIKRPGESDGACNGAPAAGRWMPDYALGLAQRAPTMVAYGG